MEPLGIYADLHRHPFGYRASLFGVFSTIMLLLFAVRLHSSTFGETTIATQRFFGYENPFCCSELAEPLAAIMNDTVNPCTHFLDYACYRMKSNGTSGGPQDVATRTVASIVQGTVNGPAGRILHLIHASCVNAFLKLHFPLEIIIAEGVLEATPVKPPFKFDDNVRTTVVLSYGYGILPFVNMTLVSAGRNTEGLTISAHRPRIQHDASKGVSDHILETVNSILCLNVSMASIMSVLQEIPEVTLHQPGKTGNASVLDSLLPESPPGTLKKSLDSLYNISNGTNVTVTSLDVVKGRLRFLTCEEAQPVGIVFAIVEAALELYGRFSSQQRLLSAANRMEGCTQDIHAYTLLLFISNTAVYTDSVKDALTLSIINKIKTTLLRRVERLLDEREKWDVRTVLSADLRPLIPIRVVQSIRHLPEVTDNYFANVLRHRTWRLKIGASQNADDVSIEELARRKPFDTSVHVAKGRIFVPPVTIGLIGSNSPEARFEHMAALGVNVAEALWRIVLDKDYFSVNLTAWLDGRRSCVEDGTDDRSSLIGMLAVQTAAAAATDGEWHSPQPVWGLWKASKSQLFYMRHFYYYACLPALAENVDDREARNKACVLQSVPDFRKAFQCPPLEDLSYFSTASTRPHT